ncbi:VanZ family protein [Saccharomonospora iraqiensis]|uniref:VanZ family protein n=1 Tax=Saccharomonospora iraqiensis TaxID=52698 RepID=UPI001378DEA2
MASTAAATATLFVFHTTLVSGGGPRRSTLSLIPGADTLPGLADPTVFAHTVGGLLLNVALFVPLGIAVSAHHIAGGLDARAAAPLAGATLSLIVESAQYALARGVTSVDDLVANTLGAWLGWLIACRTRRAAVRPRPAEGEGIADETEGVGNAFPPTVSGAARARGGRRPGPRAGGRRRSR